MKKFIASIFALLLLLTTVAFADTIVIDTDTASEDEIQATITLLRSLLSERNVELDTLPQSFTFSNGYYISIDGFTISDGLIVMEYSFSHQNEQPTNFDLWDRLYQNGVELDDANTLEDMNSYLRSSLSGGVTHVTKTYKLTDESPITIYIQPWFGVDQHFIVTFDLK